MTAELDYALNQVADLANDSVDSDDIKEAIENAMGWAGIAYSKLAEHGHPAMYAAMHVSSLVQSSLLHRVMQLPAPDSPDA